MKKILFIIFSFTLIILSSCKEENRSLPVSTGATGEVMIVTNNNETWKTQMGDTIRNYFGQAIPGLPVPEALMSLVHSPMKVFNESELFRKHHNILIVQIDPKQEKPVIESLKDQWASPQQVFRFVASSDTAMYRLIHTYFNPMYSLFKEIDIKRTQSLFKTTADKDALSIIRQNFGLEMVVPGGFIIANKTSDFLWIRQSIHRKKQDTELGFIIYSLPYKDTANFSPLQMISRRDSVVKRYIPGPTEGSYMATSTDVIQPVFTRTDKFFSGFVVETKGLWKTVNDFMGGPFISYTFIDSRNNRLITAEGYLYGPGTEQRKFIIQIEALLKTLKYYEPDTEEKSNKN